MRRNLISILLVMALVSVSQAQVSISGSIYDGAGGPLLMNVVYHAQDIDVPAGETLTIEAGCIIKMANTGTRFVVRGTLLANGTATNKIVLTSILDDTAGGDTAADGPTNGAPGQHQGVNFSPTSTASVANHMTVRFGGDQDLPCIRIVSSSCTLNSCIVEDCSKVGLELVGGETPNVSACGFDRCKVPIVLSNLDSLQGLLANTATDNSESNAIKYIGGTIATNSDVYSVNLIDGTLFWPNNMVVDENRKLTLHAGVIIKFGAPASRINLGGAFICLGTQSQPVVLTTLTDDSFGGDTNSDGMATVGTKGSWQGIDMVDEPTSVRLDHTVIRFAEHQDHDAIKINRSNVTLTNCVVEHCLAVGLNFGLRSTVQPQLEPVVENCRFDHCSRSIAIQSLNNLLNLKDNEATGNVFSNSPVVQQSFSQDAVVRRRSLIDDVLIVAAGPLVATGATFGPGCIIKMIGGSVLFADGDCSFLGTPASPVILTNILDDEFGGDSGLDGPTTGDFTSWSGVFNYLFVPGTLTMDHVRIRFGISGVHARLDPFNLSHVSAEHCGVGFRLEGIDTDLENLVAVSCGNGFELGAGLGDLRHATIANCSGVGVQFIGNYDGRIENTIAWGNGTNYVGIDPARYHHSNGEPTLAGSLGNIYADPQFVDETQFSGLRLTAGSPAIGTADPVVAQALKKDFFGSTRIADSNLDGIARPDMGAFEHNQFEMASVGRAVLGESLTFALFGPPAIGFLYVGLLDGDAFLDPYGFYLAGSPQNVFYSEPIATNFGYTYVVSNNPALIGVRFGVQCAGASLGNLTVGSLANLFVGTIAD